MYIRDRALPAYSIYPWRTSFREYPFDCFPLSCARSLCSRAWERVMESLGKPIVTAGETDAIELSASTAPSLSPNKYGIDLALFLLRLRTHTDWMIPVQFDRVTVRESFSISRVRSKNAALTSADRDRLVKKSSAPNRLPRQFAFPRSVDRERPGSCVYMQFSGAIRP